MRLSAPTFFLFVFFILASSTGGIQAQERNAVPRDLPAYGQDKPLKLPHVAERKLLNGLTLWLVERRGLPLVSMCLAVRGGSAMDPGDRRGLSAVLSATVSAGTRQRSSRQIAEELQALGADIDVGVGKDITYITLSGLSSGADTLVKILADTARNANFPENEVRLETENALQSIMASRSQPSYDLNQVFYHQLFGEHPYAFVNPRPEVIRQVSRDDLLEAYRQRFQPDRAILIMAGDLSAAEMEKLAIRHLGDWKSSMTRMADIPLAPSRADPVLLLVDRPHSVQSTIYVGRPMPAANSPDEFPLQVANTIFGGTFGSRLTTNIREDKGYTYSPHASINDWARGGIFNVAASVRNEVTAATLVEIFYELDRLATTLPDNDELSRAKRYLKGRFLLANETPDSLTFTLAGYWINGKTPKDLTRYMPAIQKVRRRDVRAMGRKYLSSRKQVVAVSGDATIIRDQLSLLGEVKVSTP